MGESSSFISDISLKSSVASKFNFFFKLSRTQLKSTKVKPVSAHASTHCTCNEQVVKFMKYCPLPLHPPPQMKKGGR